MIKHSNTRKSTLQNLTIYLWDTDFVGQCHDGTSKEIHK